MNQARVIVLVALLLPVGLLFAQTAPAASPSAQSEPAAMQAGPTTAATTQAQSKQALPTADDTNYLIGPEDVLVVSVWKEPEVSGAVNVRPDGKISMPLLNDVQAAGLTPMALKNDITEKLTKFIAEPRVTVMVTATNSQRVFVLGEVGRPGTLPLSPNMTVLQAISAAGGLTPFANQKKIYVLRTEGGKQQKHMFNYKEVLKGENEAQNIELKAGDTLVVP
jgi:polysaccharide export outer membrane protein